MYTINYCSFRIFRMHKIFIIMLLKTSGLSQIFIQPLTFNANENEWGFSRHFILVQKLPYTKFIIINCIQKFWINSVGSKRFYDPTACAVTVRLREDINGRCEISSVHSVCCRFMWGSMLRDTEGQTCLQEQLWYVALLCTSLCKAVSRYIFFRFYVYLCDGACTNTS